MEDGSASRFAAIRADVETADLRALEHDPSPDNHARHDAYARKPVHPEKVSAEAEM
jgi:hypothetical protein